MWNGQYHFILDAAIVLFFLSIEKNKIIASCSFLLSLLVKPITLLWIPILALQKKWYVVITSLMSFMLLSIPSYLDKTGIYYFDNLNNRIQSPIGGPPGIFTVDSLLRYWKINLYIDHTLIIKLLIFITIILI